MKLKLDTPDPLNPAVTTLAVSEAIELANIAVLKAGLTRLFQSGKKAVLLDFTGVKPEELKSPALSQEIFGLRSWALGAQAQVLVISAIETPSRGKPNLKPSSIKQTRRAIRKNYFA
jgi:hypothetical protein